MSKPIEFPGCNVSAVSPVGFEEMIGTLPCFHNGSACVSAWKLSDEVLYQIRNHGVDTVYAVSLSGQRHDITGKLVPTIIPLFVGGEDEVFDVTSDTGGVWK